MVDQLDAVFCEGWDAETRSVIAPLDPQQARARDESGQQYAVLLLAGGSPRVLLEISWLRYTCTVWRFDPQSRRDAKLDLRLLTDGELFLLEHTTWQYADPQLPEFDPTAGRRSSQYTISGHVREIHEPGGDGGGSSHLFGEANTESLRQPKPDFGDWAPLADTWAGVAPTATITERESVPVTVSISALLEAPSAPGPMRPPSLERLFRSGSLYRFPDQGEAAVEVHEVGNLRMPSGHLVAVDPTTWPTDELPPYTASVSPGTYPVTLSVVRWNEAPDHVRVAAARLLISDQPVASWELALRPGQDPRLLGDNQFFGVGVDAGLACFVDAAAAGTITGLFEQDTYVFDAVQGEQAGIFDFPTANANGIVFSSGWGDGSYPTWIGRTADGDVACFVADMLVVNDAAPTDLA